MTEASVQTDRSLLVIDDEESICFAFAQFFERQGWRVHVAATGRDGLAAAGRHRPDVVFLDVRLPDGSGLDVLERLGVEAPDAQVIVITAYGSLETVARALRENAFDVLAKPLDLDRAAALANRALDAPRSCSGPSEPEPPAEPTAIVGRSAAMQEVYKRIGLVARSGASVLILGRTGTGKELVARAIHDHSARRTRPFVAVNCAALPETLLESELFGHTRGAFTGAETDKPGRFEAADGGTLLLDEIGDLPLAAQVKLLRVLDSHTIERLGSVRPIKLDVRILAATHRDLSEAVAAGRFRADLFYRLAVVQIELPALADRREDILPLARHFLRIASGDRTTLSPEAGAMLERHTWPGNVRELRNAIEHAAIVSADACILPEHLPGAIGRSAGAGGAEPLEAIIRQYLAALQPGGDGLHRAAIEPLERALIAHALDACAGNRSEAAAVLGLHRNTLRHKLRALGLEATGAQ